MRIWLGILVSLQLHAAVREAGPAKLRITGAPLRIERAYASAIAAGAHPGGGLLLADAEAATIMGVSTATAC